MAVPMSSTLVAAVGKMMNGNFNDAAQGCSGREQGEFRVAGTEVSARRMGCSTYE